MLANNGNDLTIPPDAPEKKQKVTSLDDIIRDSSIRTEKRRKQKSMISKDIMQQHNNNSHNNTYNKKNDKDESSNGTTVSSTVVSKKITKGKHYKKWIKVSTGLPPLQLSTTPMDFNNMPTPGMEMGYTKESCIKSVLCQRHIIANTANSQKKDDATSSSEYYLLFDRRGGVVETNNGWILFVNFGGKDTTNQNFDPASTTTKRTSIQKHKNVFFNGGRQMTFSIDPTKKDHERTLFQYLCETVLVKEERRDYKKENDQRMAVAGGTHGKQQKGDISTSFLRLEETNHDDVSFKGSTKPSDTEEEEEEKAIVIFARLDNRSEYIFCGDCQCSQVMPRKMNNNDNEGPVEILLNLNNFEELTIKDAGMTRSSVSSSLSATSSSSFPSTASMTPFSKMVMTCGRDK